MTPKDKSYSLVRSYNFLILDTHLGGSVDRAKKCALLCVDEIIESHNDWATEQHEWDDYYKQVKEEIEKL